MQTYLILAQIVVDLALIVLVVLQTKEEGLGSMFGGSDMGINETAEVMGVIKGEALQNFINQKAKNLTIQKMPKPLGVVATDLQSGELVLFRVGNTGTAVRASSAVPGMFQPVEISGRDYVDGGLTSPVPAQTARSMGADFVIAVDISNVSRRDKLTGTLDVLLQTFAIMGHAISRHELEDADVVIRPKTAAVSSTDFEGRHLAILEGEKAAAAVMPELKARLARARAR